MPKINIDYKNIHNKYFVKIIVNISVTSPH